MDKHSINFVFILVIELLRKIWNNESGNTKSRLPIDSLDSV